jgi:hypothetical protein
MTSLMQRIRRRSPQRPVTEPDPGVPAGAEPQDPAAPAATSFRDRGRLRRRLRHLRRVRELGFRDVGGLVFDLHRFGRTNDELVAGKLTALEAVDRELRALEVALDDQRPVTELREPGIGACPRCGELHGTEARFCPACGLELRRAPTTPDAPSATTTAEAPTAVAEPTTTPAATSPPAGSP